MCDIVVGLAFIILGIVILAQGKANLGFGVVRGGPAYAVGILLLMPLPMTLLGGGILGMVLASSGLDPAQELPRIQGRLVLMTIVFYAGPVVPAFLILALCGRPDERRRRRYREDDEYDDYDRDHNRRDRFEDEDDGLSGTEFLLFSLLFLIPVVNVLTSSVLYYVWRGEQPRRASQINLLGFGIFALDVVVAIFIAVMTR